MQLKMRLQGAWMRQGAYGCCQCLRMFSEACSHVYMVLLGSWGGRSLRTHLGKGRVRAHEDPYWEILFLELSVNKGESHPGVCHAERWE